MKQLRKFKTETVYKAFDGKATMTILERTEESAKVKITENEKCWTRNIAVETYKDEIAYEEKIILKRKKGDLTFYPSLKVRC